MSAPAQNVALGIAFRVVAMACMSLLSALVKYTGSRVTADATPQTDSRRAGGRSAHERRQCAMATGAVYTREDLEGTGHTDIAQALRTLDPRVQ